MALVDDIKLAIEEAKSGKVMEAAIKIKRLIGMRKQGGEVKLKIGTINGQLLEDLLRLAKGHKNIEPLNEALQMIAEAELETKPEPKYDIQKRIYKQILGYKGTSIKDLSPEYIEEIIRSKIDLENGINKEDIIGILRQVIRKTETGSYNLSIQEKEKYIKLVEDTIMPIVEQDIESENKNISDIRILEIITQLGKSYIPDYKKAYSILEKGKQLKQFEGSDIYKENNKECDKAELLKDFDAIQCDEKNIKDVIKQYMDTFLKEVKPKNPNPEPRPDPNPDPNPKPKSKELMDLDKKIEAILFLLKELKKEFPKAKINGIYVGKEAFAKHIILPIENVPITLLENLSETSGALYITQNSNIGEFVKLKNKSKAKELTNVETANHPNKKEKFDDRYEKYKNRIIRKTKDVIDGIRKKGTTHKEILEQSQVHSRNSLFGNTPVENSTSENNPAENSILENNPHENASPENNPTEDGLPENSSPENDLLDLSTEELEALNLKLSGEIDEKTQDITDLEGEIEKAKLETKRLEEEAKRKEIIRSILKKQAFSKKQDEEISKKKSELADIKEKNRGLKDNKETKK